MGKKGDFNFDEDPGIEFDDEMFDLDDDFDDLDFSDLGSLDGGEATGKLSFFKNLGKSVKGLGVDILNNTMPEMVNIGNDVNMASGDIISKITDIKSKIAEKKAEFLANKEEFKRNVKNEVKNFGKNTLDNIKKGKFYKSDSEVDLSSLMSDDDEDYGEDEGISSNKEKEIDTSGVLTTKMSTSKRNRPMKLYISNDNKSVVESMEKIQENAIFTNARIQNRLNTKNMILTEQNYSKQMKVLTNIAENVYSIASFLNREGTTNVRANLEYMAKSLAFSVDQTNLLKDILSKQVEQLNTQKGIKEENNNNSFDINSTNPFANGFFNSSNYLNNVKQNAMSLFGGTPLGQLYDMYQMQKEMNGAFGKKFTPGQMISQFAKGSIPSLLISSYTREKMDKMNTMLEGLGGALVARMNRLSENSSSPIFSALGRLLGVDTYSNNSIEMGINNPREAVPFDQQTRKTINTVIPGYLSKITAALTNSEETYFDYKSNVFRTNSSLLKKYEREKMLAFNSNTLFSDNMNIILENIVKGNNQLSESTKLTQSEILNYFNKFKENVVKSKVELNRNDLISNSYYQDKVFKGIVGKNDEQTLEIKNLIISSVDRLSKVPGALQMVNSAIFSTSSNMEKNLKQFKESSLLYGGDLALAGKNIDEKYESSDFNLKYSKLYNADLNVAGTNAYFSALQNAANLRESQFVERGGIVSSITEDKNSLSSTGSKIDQIYNLLLDGIVVYPMDIDKSNIDRIEGLKRKREEIKERELEEKRKEEETTAKRNEEKIRENRFREAAKRSQYILGRNISNSTMLGKLQNIFGIDSLMSGMTSGLGKIYSTLFGYGGSGDILDYNEVENNKELKEALEMRKNAINNSFDSIKGVASNVSNWMNDHKDDGGVGGTISKIGSGIAEGVSKTADNLSNSGKESILTRFSNFVTKGRENISSSIGKFAESTSSKISDFYESHVNEGIRSKISNFGSNIGESVYGSKGLISLVNITDKEKLNNYINIIKNEGFKVSIGLSDYADGYIGNITSEEDKEFVKRNNIYHIGNNISYVDLKDFLENKFIKIILMNQKKKNDSYFDNQNITNDTTGIIDNTTNKTEIINNDSKLLSLPDKRGGQLVPVSSNLPSVIPASGKVMQIGQKSILSLPDKRFDNEEGTLEERLDTFLRDLYGVDKDGKSIKQNDSKLLSLPDKRGGQLVPVSSNLPSVSEKINTENNDLVYKRLGRTNSLLARIYKKISKLNILGFGNLGIGNIFKKLGDKLTSIGKKIVSVPSKLLGFGKNIFDKSIGFGKDVLSNVFNTGRGFIGGIFGKGKEIGKSLFNKGKDLFNIGKDNLPKLKDFGLNIFNRGKDFIKTTSASALGFAKKGFKTLFNNDELQNKLHKISKKIENGEELTDEEKEFWELNKDKLDENYKQGLVNKGLEFLFNGSVSAFELGKNFLYKSYLRTKGLGSKLKDKILGGKSFILNSAKAIKDKVTSAASVALKNFKDEYKKIGEALFNNMSLEEAKARLSELANVPIEALKNLSLTEIKTKLREFLSKGSNPFSGLGNKLKSGIKTIGSKIGGFFSGIGSGLSNMNFGFGFGYSSELLVETRAIRTILENQYGPVDIEKIREEIGSNRKSINIGEKLSKLKDYSSGVISGVKSRLPGIRDSALDLFGKGKDRITDLFNKGRDGVKSRLPGIRDSVLDLFGKDKDGVDSVISGVKSRLPGMKNTAFELFGKGRDRITDLFNRGKDGVKSRLPGMKNTALDIFNKGKDIADNVFSKGKENAEGFLLNSKERVTTLLSNIKRKLKKEVVEEIKSDNKKSYNVDESLDTFLRDLYGVDKYGIPKEYSNSTNSNKVTSVKENINNMLFGKIKKKNPIIELNAQGNIEGSYADQVHDKKVKEKEEREEETYEMEKTQTKLLGMLVAGGIGGKEVEKVVKEDPSDKGSFIAKLAGGATTLAIAAGTAGVAAAGVAGGMAAKKVFDKVQLARSELVDTTLGEKLNFLMGGNSGANYDSHGNLIDDSTKSTRAFGLGNLRLSTVKAVGGIAKAGLALMNKLMELIKKVLRNEKIMKYLGGEGVEKIIKAISAKAAKAVGPKISAKIAAFIAKASTPVGWAILIGQSVLDFTTGMARTSRYFKLGKGIKPTLAMRVTSGLVNMLSGFLFGLIPTETLVNIIYNLTAKDSTREAIKKGQDFVSKRAKVLGVDPNRLAEYETMTWNERLFGGDVKSATILGFAKGKSDTEGIARYKEWRDSKYKPLMEIYENVKKQYGGGKVESVNSSDEDVILQDKFREAYLKEAIAYVKKNNLEGLAAISGTPMSESDLENMADSGESSLISKASTATFPSTGEGSISSAGSLDFSDSAGTAAAGAAMAMSSVDADLSSSGTVSSYSGSSESPSEDKSFLEKAGDFLVNNPVSRAVSGIIPTVTSAVTGAKTFLFDKIGDAKNAISEFISNRKSVESKLTSLFSSGDSDAEILEFADRIRDPNALGQQTSTAILNPEFGARVEAFLSDPRVAGKGVSIRESVRSPLTQLAYFSKGRASNELTDKLMKKAGFSQGINFWAKDFQKPGQYNTWTIASNHFTGQAVDLNKGDLTYNQLGAIAQEYGINWGGYWSSPDPPHFEMDTSWKGTLPSGSGRRTTGAAAVRDSYMADASGPNGIISPLHGLSSKEKLNISLPKINASRRGQLINDIGINQKISKPVNLNTGNISRSPYKIKRFENNNDSAILISNLLNNKLNEMMEISIKGVDLLEKLYNEQTRHNKINEDLLKALITVILKSSGGNNNMNTASNFSSNFDGLARGF